jgi:hypothetical protein
VSGRSKNPRFSATAATQRTSGHAADRSRFQRLCDDDLADDSRVLGAVDALLAAADDYGKHTRKILASQDRLQALASEDAWVEYLFIEEVVNDRVNFMLAVAVRWAFHEGRNRG